MTLPPPCFPAAVKMNLLLDVSLASFSAALLLTDPSVTAAERLFVVEGQKSVQSFAVKPSKCSRSITLSPDDSQTGGAGLKLKWRRTNVVYITLSKTWRSWWVHLDLLHLLLIGDVHLLQGVLQLLVPLQQSLPQLRRQVKVWPWKQEAKG